MELVFIHEICHHVMAMAIHEHGKLAIFKVISTLLRPRFSKEFHKVHRVSCLILGVKLFSMKAFCIFCIFSIDCFEIEVINVRYAILDGTNVFKIIIFPYREIFLILHKFKIFSILMLFTKFS